MWASSAEIFPKWELDVEQQWSILQARKVWFWTSPPDTQWSRCQQSCPWTYKLHSSTLTLRLWRHSFEGINPLWLPLFGKAMAAILVFPETLSQFSLVLVMQAGTDLQPSHSVHFQIMYRSYLLELWLSYSWLFDLFSPASSQTPPCLRQDPPGPKSELLSSIWKWGIRDACVTNRGFI